MRRLVFILVCCVCATSIRAGEVTVALTQLHQQFIDLASALRSRDVSIELKIKELEQVLTAALNYFNTYNTSRNPQFDIYRPQVKKNFTRVFNELLDAAGGELGLTKQQKEQIMKLIHDFNKKWQIQGDIVTYPGLLNQWNQQHNIVVARPVVATVEPVEVAASEIAKVVAIAQAEAAKIDSQSAATRTEAAEAARRKKETQERKESKEEKEKQAQHEREAAIQRGHVLITQLAQPVQPVSLEKAGEQISIPVATPVVEASEVAKRLSALEKILQDYKVALAHALKSKMSQEEKNKLREQMVKNFVPLRKELSRYVSGRSLQKNQAEKLEYLDKDYEYELGLEFD